jgi:hypothetical protein
MKKILWLLLFLFVLFFWVFPDAGRPKQESGMEKCNYEIDFSNQFVYSFNVFNSGKGVQP